MHAGGDFWPCDLCYCIWYWSWGGGEGQQHQVCSWFGFPKTFHLNKVWIMTLWKVWAVRQRLVSECRNHSQSRPAAGGRDSLVKLLAHKVQFTLTTQLFTKRLNPNLNTQVTWHAFWWRQRFRNWKGRNQAFVGTVYWRENALRKN